MRTRLALSVAAVFLAPLAGLAKADEGSYSKHLEARSASVVAVKFVLKAGDRERNVNQTGILVDPSGVVMLSSNALRPRAGQGAKVSVVNLRVIFPGDEKEYDAIVGATDTNLGLGFIRIKDLQDKKISPVDLAAPADPKLGDELFSVTRLEQGFDYAPYFGTARVAGQVTKPRAMWVVTGFAPVAHVLYAPDGKPAGIVIQQAGVTEGDDFSIPRPFLLSMKAAMPTIQRAIDKSTAALAEEAARAKETTEEPEGGMAPEPPPPAMDEPK
jgi:hypothetical protein